MLSRSIRRLLAEQKRALRRSSDSACDAQLGLRQRVTVVPGAESDRQETGLLQFRPVLAQPLRGERHDAEHVRVIRGDVQSLRRLRAFGDGNDRALRLVVDEL